MVASKKITRISNELAYPVMLCYMMLVLALLPNLFLWISLLAILFVLWRYLFQINKTSLPTTGVLNLLALVCCALIFYFSFSAGALSGLINLLLIGSAMKLLAIKTSAGVKQLCLIHYFVIASAFIFEQGLGFTVYVFTIFVINTYALIVIFSPGLQFAQRLRYGLRFFATSLPLILFLFTLMPRLDPLWKMPTASGNSIGLSENINPGDFSNLAQSPELAFRAIFDTPVPQPAQRYWRTMVHEVFDGKQWTIHALRKSPGNITRVAAPEAKLFNNTISRYQIITEPTYQHWLYSLNTPVSHSEQVNYQHDRLLSSKKSITQPFQYRVSSASKHQHRQTIDSIERTINLQLPGNSNPRSQALAKQLRSNSGNALDYANKVLAYFVANQFIYTLEPALMPVDPVDRFVFDDRAGFCSHFASSFAFLMRAGGIPARIVSGYQGGELAENGDYLSIYQYDAHAWNEIWLDGRGWVRIDPTATVSPDRISMGLQQMMQNEENFLSGEMFELVKYRQFALAKFLREQLNNLDFYWSTWILNFDNKKQSRLFESLWGKQSTLMFGVYSALIFIVFLILIYFLAKRQHFRHNKSALFLLHQQLIRVGKLYEFERPAATAPLTWLAEFAAQQPQQTNDIDTLSRYYRQCLYQDLGDEQYNRTLGQIRHQLRQLKRRSPRRFGRFSRLR